MDANLLPDALLILDNDGKVVELNEKAEEIGFRVGMRFELKDEVEIGGRVYDVKARELPEKKIVLLRDITERKNSEELYKTFFDLSPDAIVVHDTQKVLFANRRVSEYLGIPQEKIIGMPVLSFIHPEYVEFAKQRMKKMIEEKGIAPPAIEKFVLPNGRVLDVEVTASYITFNNSPAIVLVIRDVTEKIEMERKVRESEKRYREFFENALDMIVVTDLQGNFVEVNKEFEKMSGYRREEVIGRNYREFFSEREAEYIFRMYNKAFRERKPLYGLEFKFTTKYGIEKIVEGNVRPLIKDGTVNGFLAIFKDITERKRLEEELVRTNKLLRTINTINEIIVREKDLEKLLSTLISEVSNYCSFAWLALIKDEMKMKVKSFGVEFSEELMNGECIKEAIKSRRTVVKLAWEHPRDCVNFQKHGGLNAYIFPLNYRKLLGVLAIYSEFQLSEEEVKLLQTLADDVAFAIDAIELEKAREESLKQIEKNIEQFAILVDKIRNPLAIIAGLADIFAEKEKDKIFEQVKNIEKIIEQLEKGWLESEDVRRLLRGFRDEENPAG